MMKKIVLRVSVLLCLFTLLTSCKNKQDTGKVETVSTNTKAKNEKQSDQVETQKEDEQKSKQKKEELVKEFGKRWVNYPSIDERNASVQSFMTNECQKENGIGVKTNAVFDATGQVLDVYESTSVPDTYIVFGTEEYKGNRKTIVLTIQLETTKSDVKISKLVVNYVQQAY